MKRATWATLSTAPVRTGSRQTIGSSCNSDEHLRIGRRFSLAHFRAFPPLSETAARLPCRPGVPRRLQRGTIRYNSSKHELNVKRVRHPWIPSQRQQARLPYRHPQARAGVPQRVPALCNSSHVRSIYSSSRPTKGPRRHFHQPYEYDSSPTLLRFAASCGSGPLGAKKAVMLLCWLWCRRQQCVMRLPSATAATTSSPADLRSA